METVRPMLAEGKTSIVFWTKSEKTVMFLLNQTGVSPVQDKRPYELYIVI